MTIKPPEHLLEPCAEPRPAADTVGDAIERTIPDLLEAHRECAERIDALRAWRSRHADD